MREITLLNGKKYPVFLDYNIIAKIQDKCGDIKKLPELMHTLDGLAWVVKESINEGIAKRNYDMGTADNGITDFEIGMWLPIEPEKISDIGGSILDAFYDCMGGRKNAEAVVKQTGKTLPNLTGNKKAGK